MTGKGSFLQFFTEQVDPADVRPCEGRRLPVAATPLRRHERVDAVRHGRRRHEVVRRQRPARVYDARTQSPPGGRLPPLHDTTPAVCAARQRLPVRASHHDRRLLQRDADDRRQVGGQRAGASL